MFLKCFKSRDINRSTFMGKQKLVIRVCMADAKKRSKALQTVVGLQGVLSASIEGEENDRIVVIGDGIDPAILIMILREKMRFAELVSVSPVEEKDEDKEKKEDETKETDPESSSKSTAEPVIYHHGASMMQPCIYVVECDPFWNIFQ